MKKKRNGRKRMKKKKERRRRRRRRRKRRKELTLSITVVQKHAKELFYVLLLLPSRGNQTQEFYGGNFGFISV
jgi:hypothetical protein